MGNTFYRTNDEGLREHVDGDSGEVLGIQADESEMPGQPFSEVIADLICEEIIKGKNITEVARDPRIPGFYTITKWREYNKAFDASIRQAFSARADVQHDRLIEVAEKITTKDEAVVKKPLIEALKWSAEKTNPDQYGQKTKISGDPAAPLQLIIDTGVPAPESLPERPVEEISNSVNNEALPESGGIEKSGDNTEAAAKDS